MTANALYRNPVMLDSNVHRGKKLAELTDYSVAASMHATYLAAIEFPQAAREMVIVFVRSDNDPASGPISPVVMMGVREGENLLVDGTRWDARYVPGYLRRYPFWTTRLEGSNAPTVLIDDTWSGFSDTDGEALFDADGKPAPRLTAAIKFIEDFEFEAARTKAFCTRLVELELLRGMSASASLPGGETVSLDGFLVVDTDKLQALPDAVVVDLHRTGILGLIHAHLLSLANLQVLVERKTRRMNAAMD